MIPEALFADRTRAVEVSGMRKVFELARSLKDPVNLSIGQPHFDVPDAIKARREGRHRREPQRLHRHAGHPRTARRGSRPTWTRASPIRTAMSSSPAAPAAGCCSRCFAVVNPGDEVITTDPYFVAYPHMVALAGGKLVTVDTYPDFRVDVKKVEAAITPRTKVILLSSPVESRPARCSTRTPRRRSPSWPATRGVLLISDEIYRAFHYDGAAAIARRSTTRTCW